MAAFGLMSFVVLLALSRELQRGLRNLILAVFIIGGLAALLLSPILLAVAAH